MAVWSAILLHFAGNAGLSLFPQTSDAAALLQFAVTTVIAVASLLVWRALDRRKRAATSALPSQAAVSKF